MRPVWDEVARELWDIEKQQFASEGGAGASGKWPELTLDYKAQKVKRYPGAKILQRTGAMYESLTGQTGDTVLIKEKQSFAIGSSLKYPPFHQRGDGNLPQRAVIDFSEEQKRKLQKGIQRGLLEIIKRDPSINSVLRVT